MDSISPGAGGSPEVSVVIPMYNEGDHVHRSVRAVCEELRRSSGYGPFEVVCVDDGSTDSTREELERLSGEIEEVRVVGYESNCGRGRALREGFSAARGSFIVSIDADLSYHPGQIVSLVQRLKQPDRPDVVIASPYMPGGKTDGVDFFRLIVSRAANVLLRQAMGRKYYTLTGIFRGYRREVFDQLDLYSDGKEIHLEIVARAEASGLRLVEVPAVLKSRKHGASKLKLRLTVVSHLMFSFYERPILLFGMLGLVLTLCSLAIGGYLVYLYWISALNPTRPLVWLSILLLLSGIQVASFAFISTQITVLKKEIFRIQKEVLLFQKALKREKSS
ncbi:MAG: glycosyltransferase [Gemmatimonadota bacterium]|nr:glycosyltransferase [Gemmatimonadota bacterium]